MPDGYFSMEIVVCVKCITFKEANDDCNFDKVAGEPEKYLSRQF